MCIQCAYDDPDDRSTRTLLRTTAFRPAATVTHAVDLRSRCVSIRKTKPCLSPPVHTSYTRIIIIPCRALPAAAVPSSHRQRRRRQCVRARYPNPIICRGEAPVGATRHPTAFADLVGLRIVPVGLYYTRHHKRVENTLVNTRMFMSVCVFLCCTLFKTFTVKPRLSDVNVEEKTNELTSRVSTSLRSYVIIDITYVL